MQTVASRHRFARDRAKLTQREVADRAGLASPSHVCQIEQGAIHSPSADVIERLARAMGVRPEWLAFGTGKMLPGRAA